MDPSWRLAQRENLVNFGRSGYDANQGGFGRLQDDGHVLIEKGLETWINARAAYTYSLDVLAGNEKSRVEAELAGNALREILIDDVHGGWFTGVATDGTAMNSGQKEAYTHAFVLLAASALRAIESPLGEGLFSEAEHCIDDKFWSADENATTESWTRGWSSSEAYRGANSNMHMTEASLAAFDITGEEKWLGRAGFIVQRIVRQFAKGLSWRIPEHFDREWVYDPDYNLTFPDHPFRPYGVTPGHGFEWARLILHLSEGFRRAGREVPSWYLEAAESLYNRALQDSWNRNGHPGFCYTVDLAGKVVIPLHFAWVACEALSAAVVLHKVTNKLEYLEWSELIEAYLDEYVVDREKGGWRSELDSENAPSARVWGDKTDFYHPLQALLLPRARLAPSMLSAL